MSIVPFKAEHLEELMPTLGIPLSNLPDGCVKLFATEGHAYTALKQGRPVGAAGVMPIWAGVGEAVGFLTKEFREHHPKTLHKSVSWGLAEIQRNFKYHRIQLSVTLGYHVGYRWAERLGFKWEGVMPLYTIDKRTFVRFGKVWI